MRARIAAGVLALGLVGTALTACSGGGGDDADSGPGSTPSVTASAPPRASAAEYAEAQTLYRGLADVLNQTNKRSATYQDVVRNAWEDDPQGFRKAPRVVKAVRQQRDVAAKRDAALAALAAHPAMVDEELSAAYQAFQTQYAAAAAYQDGFDRSFPLFLAVGTACQRIFGVEVTAPAAFTAYAGTWLERHQEAAAPCLKLSAGLAESENEDLARLSDRYARLVAQRRKAVVRLRDGASTPRQALKAITKANRDFARDYARLTQFSERLAALVPTSAYAAIAPILDDRVAE